MSSVAPGLTPLIDVPGWPIVRPPLLMNQLGPLLAVTFGAPFDEDTESVFLRELTRHFDSRQGKELCVLYHLGATYRAETRTIKRLSVTVKPYFDLLKATTAAFGFVSESAFGRAAIKTVLFASPLPYPASVYSTPEAAFRAFARAMPTVEAAALESAYEDALRRQLPAMHREWRGNSIEK